MPTADGSAGWAAIQPSDVAQRTFNPIRDVLSRPAQPLATPRSTKEPISLSIGDPTVFGNFKAHPAAVEAVEAALRSYSFNGYPSSVGVPEARAAVAARHSRPSAPLTAEDVVITSGCSGAVEMAIGVLCSAGQNILLPRPGFCLYNTVASSRGVEARLYDLVPERCWEADLGHMESLIDANTATILINNPSNPCGSNFSKAHLRAILDLCERRRVPLISDEIYADMVFGGQVFTPAATLTATVPILTLGGLAKQWLVPGWRIGWILVHDRGGALAHVRRGLFALSTLINGACAPVQAAIPAIFDRVPDSFLPELNRRLEAHARTLEAELARAPGLEVISPQGAMYIMARLDMAAFADIASDAEFCRMLRWEENVEILPGEYFAFPGSVRFVITPPQDKLRAAAERIAAFCQRHARTQ